MHGAADSSRNPFCDRRLAERKRRRASRPEAEIDAAAASLDPALLDALKLAARRLEALGGGMIAVCDGEVLAELALPIAGLITDEPLQVVDRRMAALEAAAKALGVILPDPYMALSFLGLAVIPELRLTDLGLVDVRQGRLVPLAVE